MLTASRAAVGRHRCTIIATTSKGTETRPVQVHAWVHIPVDPTSRTLPCPRNCRLRILALAEGGALLGPHMNSSTCSRPAIASAAAPLPAADVWRCLYLSGPRVALVLCRSPLSTAAAQRRPPPAANNARKCTAHHRLLPSGRSPPPCPTSAEHAARRRSIIRLARQHSVPALALADGFRTRAAASVVRAPDSRPATAAIVPLTVRPAARGYFRPSKKQFRSRLHAARADSTTLPP